MIRALASLPLAALLLATDRVLLAQTDLAAPMAGLSNHGRTGDRPYVAAGDRAYLIGTQDGNFPDMGGHVRGEMGGLWLHPIKLIDGFRATVTDSAMQRTVVLSRAAEFINYPYGNRVRYGTVLDSLTLDRFQFSPDGRQGVVVQYVFRNDAARARRLGLDFVVKTDLLPVWYSDQLGIHDAPDAVAWHGRPGVFVARDRAHPWFAVWGAAPPAAGRPLDRPDSIATSGQGATGATRYHLSVAPHDSATLTFVLAGSDTSERDALASWAGIARDHVRLLQAKRDRYASMLATARISIPDQRLQQVYDWVRINTQWTVRDVPGIGRGVGGGLMEYPWWFGTETYTLQALVASGRSDLAETTLRLLRSQSQKANGNGRILHEVTTNGGVSNRGNTQETAQFILTAGQVVQWTGDLAFAREMYPAMTQGLHWLLVDVDRNHDLFPEGYGITEILGLNAELIDAAAYTQQALAATAKVAALLGHPADAARYRALAGRLETRINGRFWRSGDSSYADFYGTRAQAVSAAEGSIKQIKLKEADGDTLTARDRERIAYYERLGRRFAAMPDSSGAWMTNKNWVVATPMEIGIAPPERARLALDKIRRDDVGEYGPFLSAVDRGAMMTISTGVLAVAEGRYGRIDRAKWYMDRIVDTFGRTLPGSISEMMPDYGCFVIAWTNYGIIVPLVEEVFGIAPDAPKRTVVFDPQVPSGWKRMRIDALPVGDNTISFAWAETERGVEYDIGGTKEGWSFIVKADTTGGTKYYLNERPVTPSAGAIRMSGLRNTLVVTGGQARRAGEQGDGPVTPTP
ncbi:MAG: alpha-L-rhamnosidase-related protein [Gemmatimonadales bacterium]